MTVSSPTSSVRPERHRLESDLGPIDALHAMADDRHPVALVGEWFGGGALVASEPLVVIRGPDGDDPFLFLDTLPRLDGAAPAGAVCGGWFGYLGYRVGQRIERLPEGPPRPHPLPDWWLGWYDHVLRFDPATGWWFECLWTAERADELARRRDQLAARLRAPAATTGSTFRCGPFAATPGAEDHRKAVRRTLEHIGAGDIYQANVCLRLDAPFTGRAVDLFATGATATRPSMGAFVDLAGGEAVVSLSPERFLSRSAHDVRTVPIKGTRRRRGDAGADRLAARDLSASTKDRAENVMIVDLMRNDLGRVCVPGSIQVPRLFDVEPHPGVWHLVSEVRGTLRPGVGDGALLRATCPPGSVTGAPKVRAMEVIAEVEATGREVYTGAIGAVSPVAGADWNVAIRTFEVSGDHVWLGAGGGIVADSDPEAELEECRVKARPLLDAIGARLDAGV